MQQGRNFTDLAIVGYGTTSGTYNISTQFCMPDSSNVTAPTVQVLTHGIGFDKTYWDSPYAGYNYSYVNTAVDQFKYCILSLDRLGVGNSSHGEPLNEIQSKVVHVGHSFGSAQTYSLANLYPELTDGIILTGFSMNASFVPFFAAGANFQQANLNQPLRLSNITGQRIQTLLSMYADPLVDYIAPIDLSTIAAPQMLPNGYLVSSNAEANKYLFLKPKFYDAGILTLAEATKQPVTLGELLTLGSLVMMNNYNGPTMVITGDSDLPYCGGDCLATGVAATSIPAMVKMNFPNVSDGNFSAVVKPNTGHGINFHYNATGAYNVINDFLGSKGLASS
ncbi:hypothetical protein BKA65DRAFT_527260 [Rhexocercosporidium sp. MPI-PUGE-AT-0058]|nr:hypothetical protein BKA65DRAFT_527260 [Rhexocercosporidium sp. MPI-PUGE-AT-0058]